MSETCLSLPRIIFSRGNMDEASLIIEGQNQLHVRNQINCTQSLDGTRQRILPGEMKMRSVTTRSYTARPRLWASEERNVNKDSMRARTANGRLSAEMSVTQGYNVNELIAIIKEKLTNSHKYVHQMFCNNDPKGQGTISREALTRVLWNLCGFLTTKQINNLLNRLNLFGKSSISFEDFRVCFQDKVHNTEWIKPNTAKHLQRNVEKPKCTAATDDSQNGDNDRAWRTLGEEASKSESLEKFLPPCCLCASGMITLEQFTTALKCMGVMFNEEELLNMWTRTENVTRSAIPAVFLYRKLGIKFPVNGKAGTISNDKIVKSFEEVIYSIKEKLNEACLSLVQEFSKMNTSRPGLINRSEVRLVLQKFNIPMTAVDLEHLLARFNMRRKDGLVDFLCFVNKLKSRSRISFMKKMVEQAEQRQSSNVCGNSSSTREWVSAEEAEWLLFQLCQGPFIQLLAQFRQADALGNGCINQDNFKEIIEKTIHTVLTPEQIKSFAVFLGEEDSNFINFMKFVALLQDRPSTFELKEEVEHLSSRIKVHHRIDKIRYHKNFEMDLSRYTHAQTPRNLPEIHLIVWDLLQHKFWQFCRTFINECRNDECSADKEKLDAVLFRMNHVLLPEELEILWHSLPITYPVESISLRKLLSYFVNMKRPKDLGNRRERPVETIQTRIAKDIIKYWKEIKSILRSRDPRGTGQVSFAEICSIFLTLQINVGPIEFDILCQACDLNLDGNFHYIPFLQFYTKKKNI
ncbi:EF-hand calcium-binding domain-containing protein 6-like isoform X2 [Dendropsophus ebraccatus]|uniref:EF-hand calcium-binding domain-containing protein 6-like isoform X2 n=1 Tax=Dendropsophus ebraccatus TaxID=150705 RepID=UPI0038310462